MFCLNLRLLIHNRTRIDCSYGTPAPEFWLASVGGVFYTKQRMVSLVMHLRDGSLSIRVHPQTNRFVRQIWLEVSFPRSPFLHRTPCEINATQTKHLETDSLARWIMARHEGEENFLFYFIRCFSLPPCPSACRRRNIKGELLPIQAINYSHCVRLRI